MTPPRGRSGPQGGSPRPRPRQKGRPAAPAGAASRIAAAELLVATVDNRADLDGALAATASYAALSGPDRGFARASASAALRALGRIDAGLSLFLQRPVSELEPAVRALLRVGAAQLWILDTPAYAAVSACVDAARHWPDARRGGSLVNAVLRRCADNAVAFAELDPLLCWPDWLAARYRAALGPDAARRLADIQLEEPAIDLTPRDARQAQALAERLDATLLPSGSIRLPPGAQLTELDGYDAGEFWVQDAAAALPARLLGDLAGRRVLDLCAAPGGKTLQLCAAGAAVTALDVSAQRMARLQENLARTRLTAETVVADARTFQPERLFDAILLDAPCSALGVVRRHPEGAWRREPSDMARFPAIQTALLASARDMLSPGGVLVYCVCTPLPEEGRDVTAAAIRGGRWKRRPVEASDVPGFGHAITPDGDLLTAPSLASGVSDDAHSDVFYIARLEPVG